MSDSFEKFMQSKPGCQLLHDIHRIAEAVDHRNLDTLHRIVDGQLVPLEKLSETQPELRLPNHGMPIAQARLKLHNLREETKDWNFTEVRSFYSQSYSFRQAENGFYRFVGTLLGHAPDQLFAVNIMGDCGCNTYKCSESLTLPKFASWIAHSYPDYLLSKGTERPSFQLSRAELQVAEYFKEYKEEHAARFADEWENLYNGVIHTMAGGCINNASDLYRVFEEAISDLDLDAAEEKFTSFILDDFYEHEWGQDYDAQAYCRIEQLRWFGLYLLQQFPEVK